MPWKPSTGSIRSPIVSISQCEIYELRPGYSRPVTSKLEHLKVILGTKTSILDWTAVASPIDRNLHVCVDNGPTIMPRPCLNASIPLGLYVPGSCLASLRVKLFPTPNSILFPLDLFSFSGHTIQLLEARLE